MARSYRNAQPFHTLWALTFFLSPFLLSVAPITDQETLGKQILSLWQLCRVHFFPYVEKKMVAPTLKVCFVFNRDFVSLETYQQLRRKTY